MGQERQEIDLDLEMFSGMTWKGFICGFRKGKMCGFIENDENVALNGERFEINQLI